MKRASTTSQDLSPTRGLEVGEHGTDLHPCNESTVVSGDEKEGKIVCDDKRPCELEIVAEVCGVPPVFAPSGLDTHLHKTYWPEAAEPTHVQWTPLEEQTTCGSPTLAYP